MPHKLFKEFDTGVFDYGKEDKVLFYNKLKTEYLKISMIDGYENIQNKLYENKTKRKIIEFELVRIKKIVDENSLMLERIISIEKLLEMYDDEIPNDIYEKIINLIIRIELSLNMKIGLFRELCNLYEFENNKDEISYMRKKINGECL